MGAARTLKNAARPFTGPRINTQDMPSAPMGTGGGMPLPPQQPMSNATPNKGGVSRAIQNAQGISKPTKGSMPLQGGQNDAVQQALQFAQQQAQQARAAQQIPPQQAQGTTPSKVAGAQGQMAQQINPMGRMLGSINPSAVDQDTFDRPQRNFQGLQGLLQMLRGRR